MVSVVVQDARGGAVVREVTRERSDGTVETERQLTPPNGKLALEYLARTRAESWRPVKAIDVSGPKGGAVPFDDDIEVIQRLATRIAAVKARRAEWENRKS
jgi:hypothetical protein